jgi:hypothetical protein
MKYIFLFVIIITFFSCDKVVKKKVYSSDILLEELKSFNWNEVDVYPSFSNCDQEISKEAKKVCFQNTLSEFIFKSISKEKIVVTQSINDTVFIDFQISEIGNLSVLKIKYSDLIKEEIPRLDNLIYRTLDLLPTIFPATKRGQQVKTQFKLPIVIKVN